MKHWHRCKRWRRFGLPCPFQQLPEHEPDEEEDEEEGHRGRQAARKSEAVAEQANVGELGVPEVEAVSKLSALTEELQLSPEGSGSKRIVPPVRVGQDPAFFEDIAGGTVQSRAIGQDPPFFEQLTPGRQALGKLVELGVDQLVKPEVALGQAPPWFEQIPESVAQVTRVKPEQAQVRAFAEKGTSPLQTRLWDSAASISEEVVSSVVRDVIRAPLTLSQLKQLAQRHNIPTLGQTVQDNATATQGYYRPIDKPYLGARQGALRPPIQFPNIMPRTTIQLGRAAVLP